MDEFLDVQQKRAEGYYCSQIIVSLALDLMGRQNPDLLRSVHALAGGIGFSGQICGALTGGACMLGLYAGKGMPEEEEDERLNLMLLDLVDWFSREVGSRHGGMNCDDILEDNTANFTIRCPGIVHEVYQKCKELLVAYGFDLSGNPRDE